MPVGAGISVEIPAPTTLALRVGAMTDLR